MASTPTAAPRTDTVKVFLIGLGDGKIGCNDAAVAVERKIAPTSAPLTAAVNELLSLKVREYGQSGLYNALYQSNLTVERITVADGKATIRLAGQLRIGGVCDAPRVEAQIEQTALQFATVDQVDIFVNGTRLERVLSQR